MQDYSLVVLGCNSGVSISMESSADSKLSWISLAMYFGGGRFSMSSRKSSLSQNMSKDVLSLFIISTYENVLNRSVSFRFDLFFAL